MDINFIKWLVGYAEGFEEGSTFGVPCFNYVHNDENNLISEHKMEESKYYPLLLQRAIEGLNQANHKNRIEIAYNMVEVLDSEEYDVLKGFLVDQMTYEYDQMTFDQAKEAALKYIYSQEI